MTAAAPAAPPRPPATGARTQEDLDRLLRHGFDALDARLLAAVADLPDERWRTRRADGGWSVGEVLEHMCLSNAAYLERMRAMVDGGGPAGAAGGAWRPTLTGGLVTRALEAPARLRAPRSIQPGPTPRPDVLAALVATHDAVRALLDRAAALDWRRLRMTSPWAWFVRPNFGDACLIVLRHGERHAGQIERLIAGFPPAR